MLEIKQVSFQYHCFDIQGAAFDQTPGHFIDPPSIILANAVFNREPIQVDLKFPASNRPLRSDTIADFLEYFQNQTRIFANILLYSIPADIVFMRHIR